MNPAYRLLLAGAEAAERATGPENAAILYRTVADQTVGEAETSALLGFLRCAIASRNAQLLEQAILRWSDAGGAASAVFELVDRLGKLGNEEAAMSLARREHARTKSPESSYLCGLGFADVLHDAEMAVRAFHEAERHARPGPFRDTARARRLASAVRIPRRRRRALREAKGMAQAAPRKDLERRLLAQVELYAPSRFRRTAAVEELGALAGSASPEANNAAYALSFYIECWGDAATPMEHDRVQAYFDAEMRRGGLTSRSPRPSAPGEALRRRAVEVREGALPQAHPADTSMHALLLEFVAEAALPDGQPARHTETLLARLHRGVPINASYTYTCLEHVWRNPRLPAEGRARTLELTRAVLALPGFPSQGFLGLALFAPAELSLDFAYAASAADEPGADTALLRAAKMNASDLETSYRVLRDIRETLR